MLDIGIMDKIIAMTIDNDNAFDTFNSFPFGIFPHLFIKVFEYVCQSGLQKQMLKSH